MKKNYYFFALGCCMLANAVFVHSQTTITLNLTKTYQTIEGFGGFGAKKVWWDPAPHYDQAFIDLIVDDMGCKFVRTQIYWDGENVNDNADPNVTDMTKFNFGTTSDNGKQFAYLKALDAKGVKIIATVWTPPLWMKDFSDATTIPAECYNCWDCPKPWTYPIPDKRKMCGGVLMPSMYEEFAEYLVAYVKKVKEATGVDIYAINIQNEPLFANPFEACVMRPAPYAAAFKVVGERFDKEALPTKLFGAETMAEYTWIPGNMTYVDEMFVKSDVGQKHLDFYSVHGYVDGVANDFGSADGWSNLYNNIAAKYGKQLWMTETGNNVANNFSAAFDFAKAFHLALRFGNVSGYVFWGIAGNLVTNNQLTHTGHMFKTYFKFVRPGFVRVESTTTDNALLTTAFKKGTDYVVMIVNNSGSNKIVNLNMGATTVPSKWNVYHYNGTDMYKDRGEVSGNSFTLTANSVTALVYKSGVAVDEMEISEDVQIYPNPVSGGVLHVERRVLNPSVQNPSVQNASVQTTVQITNMQGVVVKSEIISGNKKSIDVSSLPAGVYQVGVYSDVKIWQRQILIP